MTQAYSHLLAPGRIGSMALRNRMVVSAMGVSLAEADGSCGERIRAYHAEQAKGGAALIITGAAGVAWPVGGVQRNQLAVSNDRLLPGLTALADAVHAHGAKLAFQLHHGGPIAMEDMLAGRPIYVPSLPQPSQPDMFDAFLPDELAASAFGRIQAMDFRAMTVVDIRSAVDQFAAAAARVKQAGADGVEIHGGHGYLLSSFLSPQSNRRSDAYGGSLENRARLLLEVLQAVRDAVGPDFPVWVKLDSREVGKQGGITIDDAVAVARRVEAAGANAVTVTADFISLGRKLLADPHLPRKLAEGRAADIRPCIYCYTCISAIYTSEPARCAVNPEIGFEYLESAPAGAAKNVVVIGGGPGGMEAAWRLDAQGHRVTLLEKSHRLGGSLRFAALAYEANQRLLDWLLRRIEASAVTLRLGTEATPELLRSLKPDAVLVATGARRELPPLPGADLPQVFSGDELRALMLGEDAPGLAKKTGLLTRLATRLGAATGATANLEFVRQATRWWMPFGRRIVIVGGELVGLELAEFLNQRGRQVAVVEEASRLGAGLALLRRMRLLDELKEHGVALHRQAADIRIETEGVRFVDPAGQMQFVAADHVIVARGASADLRLAEQLRAAGFAVFTAGDCEGVGYIEGALRGAARAVRDFRESVAAAPKP